MNFLFTLPSFALTIKPQLLNSSSSSTQEFEFSKRINQQIDIEINSSWYKFIGLTDSEINYINNVNIEKFVRKLDKYVEYDKLGFA